MRGMILIGAMLLVMVPALVSSSAQSLRVYSNTSSLVWCTSINPGDIVQLQFTHSMYGGYVREHWRVSAGNQLDRVRFVTQNAAAAEYYATDGTSYQDDDGFVVPTNPLTQPELVVRVNSRGNHVLSANEESVNLAEVLLTSTQVRIAVEPGSCPE